MAEPSGDEPSLAVAWRTGGAGPPPLLVNGYAATSEDRDPSFVAALEQTRRSPGEVADLIATLARG